MVDVIINNTFSKWDVRQCKEFNIYFSGYFQINNMIIDKNNALEFICNRVIDEPFDLVYLAKIFKETNGSWAIIINSNEYTLMVSDIFRTIPIYYSYENSNLKVSDTTVSLVDKLKDTNYNKENINLYLKESSAPSGQTIVNNLFDVEAGEMVLYKKSIQKIQYYFMPSKLLHINEDMVLTEMNKIYSSIFEKMAAYCDKHSNLPIFLPLSGGMDSRFIAWAIKKNNIKNRIIAFTYGKSSNAEEALISKQVAESFNWNWVFIEYSNYEWQQVKIDLIQLTKDFSIHKSSIHINDYIAIKYLKNNFGKGIVLVGHLMDHFAGLSIPNELKFNNTIKVDNLIWGNPIYDNRLSSYEHFYKNTRTATYIINSIRMYEYFELKYCLPYANIELATLWYSLPTTYRIERNLFRIYLNKYAYINEYKFLLDIPIALGRRMDDKFIELNKIDKTKIVMKYYLKKFNVINLIKKTQKEKIRKSNAEGDYIGFYELFDDKDLGFDKFDKNYLELVAMSVIKNIKY